MRLNFPCFRMMVLLTDFPAGLGCMPEARLTKIKGFIWARRRISFPSTTCHALLVWSVFSVHGMSEPHSMGYPAFSSPCKERMKVWRSRGVSRAWLISDLPSGFSGYSGSVSYLPLFLSCVFSCWFCSPDDLPF